MKQDKVTTQLLDKDTQTLLEAGLLDKDITVSNKGFKELINLLFITNKVELVKLAEEIIKEKKENKECDCDCEDFDF